jgi:superfamily II DNA/RNA helicase
MSAYMYAETGVLRQRLLEILNNDGYPAPIIVFVNQKKTADMVAKGLSRAGVSGGRRQL